MALWMLCKVSRLEHPSKPLKQPTMKNFALCFISSMILTLSSTSYATTYYISSSSGNDSNSGTSSSAPRKTIPTLQTKNTYLLKRGDTFYNRIPRVYNPTIGNIITVSAYGTGDKPVLNQYATILPTAWVQYNSTVWKVSFSNASNFSGYNKDLSPDIGFLKLNGTTIKGAKKPALSNLKAQWDFYSDSTYLYVYSTSKPSTLATQIQASLDHNAVDMSDNMVLSEVKITGSAQHSIGMVRQSNCVIRKVDIEEGGGSYLGGYGSGTSRYGNGIQIFNGGSNILVEGCSIKQIYDVALTMQTANGTLSPFQDITFQSNYVDSCEQSFENTISQQTSQPGFSNCKVFNNEFRNAGYGWSHNVRPHQCGVHLLSYQWYTSNNGLTFENNTIYRAKDGLYYAQNGSTTQSIPPYISKNNDIWLDPTTLVRMNYPGQSIYKWTVSSYSSFVSSSGKEGGSTWHDISKAGMAPVISSGYSASGTVGMNFSYQVTASNSPTSFSASGLPSGLTINTSTGIISGTPSLAGSFAIAISATNAYGTGSTTLNLVIQSVVTTQQVVSFTLINADSNTEIQKIINGSTLNLAQLPTRNLNIRADTNPGIVGSVVFNFSGVESASHVESGAPYAAFGDSNGDYLPWTPKVGSYTLKATPFTVSNGSGTAGTSLTITFTIADQSAPVITSSSTASGRVGTAFSYQIAASNSPTAFSATGLPSGLSVNSTTGLISGTPTVSGTFSVKLAASNQYGTGAKTLSMTINKRWHH